MPQDLMWPAWNLNKPAMAPIRRLHASLLRAFRLHLLIRIVGEPHSEDMSRLTLVSGRAVSLARLRPILEGFTSGSGRARRRHPPRPLLSVDQANQRLESYDNDCNLYLYSVCLATGPGNPRCTLIEPMAWLCFARQPEVRQTYYCHCWAKYRAKWGVVCEVVVDGGVLYSKATIPPYDSWDPPSTHAADSSGDNAADGFHD